MALYHYISGTVVLWKMGRLPDGGAAQRCVACLHLCSSLKHGLILIISQQNSLSQHHRPSLLGWHGLSLRASSPSVCLLNLGTLCLPLVDYLKNRFGSFHDVVLNNWEHLEAFSECEVLQIHGDYPLKVLYKRLIKGGDTLKARFAHMIATHL